MDGPGYSFGAFRLEPDGTLYRGTAAIHLPPKELAALRLLLERSGQIVTPGQVRQALWGDVHVSEDSVPKCLSSLRSRLAPDEFIQTVYKRGYRFSAEVRVLVGGRASQLPRLAIVPFEHTYGFPEHIGFAVVEETADRLVNMRPAVVSVIARDSVFTLAKGERTAQQLGRELRADLVLTGTLRALPGHFRLRACMVRVEDETEIWVEDMLVERSRMRGLETALADRLMARLGGGTAPGVASISAGAAPFIAESRPSAQTREAHEMYLRARCELKTLERHRLQDALQLLLRATELDPALAAAQVELANLCCTQALYGFMSPGVAAENVHRAAAAIPEGTHEADAVLPAVGWVRMHMDRDLRGAEEAFDGSAHLPHDGLTSRLRAMFAVSRGRYAEAGRLLAEAIDSDPYSSWLQARLAWVDYLGGRHQESVDRVHRSLAAFPGDDAVAFYGSLILGHAGEAVRAIELAAAFARRHPYFDIAAAAHAYALARAGRSDEARAIVEKLQWLSRERYVLSSFTAAVCLALGQPDAAIAELRSANQNRCPWFFQMLSDPRLAGLGKHPEFAQMREILPRMETAAERGEFA